MERHSARHAAHRKYLQWHARWGLVNRWARDNSRASQCINAKAETLEERPTFREAFQRRRCVVPADGSTNGRAQGPTAALSRRATTNCYAKSDYTLRTTSLALSQCR